MKPFQVDKPLWIFVGHTVTGGQISNTDDKESVSDVVEVLLFLKAFLAAGDESVAIIQSLLEEGFRDQNERDLLAHRLPHIDVSGDKPSLARELHQSILRDVFNAPNGGKLAVQMMRGATGELALKVGEQSPFGVVNVGDPLAVADACERKGVVRLEDDSNRASLFQGINRDDSPINLLVGSRKFTEGWNSWRVSSIGLMRMGKSEGTQIIQLFGRGVRLRGYQMSLRRSSVLASKPSPPKNLRQVETLQVFGVKATYMNTFRDWIFSEVPEAQEKQIWELPVVENLKSRKLKILRVREEIDGAKVKSGEAFHTLGPLVILRPPDLNAPEEKWLCQHPTKLNWLPRIRGLVGVTNVVNGQLAPSISADIGIQSELPKQKLTTIPHYMFDIDELLFGLEAYKASHRLDRLHVDRGAIVAMLQRDDWYELLATADDMRLDRYQNRSQWQRMAQQLLNSYSERFHSQIRQRWEAPYLEVVELAADHPNMLPHYTIETTEVAKTLQEMEAIAKFIDDLKRTLGNDKFASWIQFNGKWRTVPFGGHLYQPLLHVGENAQIRVIPVALNTSEVQFVEDLAKWCGDNQGRDVYLLRNQAVTGLGFFVATKYFPDFLMWVQDEQHQHLVFVDPKGLHHLNESDPKVQFATRDVPRLQQIVNRHTKDLQLHAFILSNTPFAKLGWSSGAGRVMTKAEVEQLGVLFQVDDATTYVATLMKSVAKMPLV